MSKKKVLITGITGQDGSYLTEILLEKDYEVHGMLRRSSSFNTDRIDHLYNDPEIYNKNLFLHYGDLVDTSSIHRMLEKIEPDEIYNLDAQRDWGYAPEYCEGMWRMLQQEEADDFVLATGETHTIREFCELTFAELGIELKWQGEGENEKGVISSFCHSELVSESQKSNLQLNDVVIAVNPRYYRPTEVELLIGNPEKAKNILGWEAQTKFEELAKLMTVDDLALVTKLG